MRGILPACALALLSVAWAAVPARLLDPARDEVLLWTPVPSAQRAQGQVRIVDRDGATVVQTVLDTKLPKRVLGRIAEKEAAHWPAGVDGHDDAERYLAALREALLAETRRADRRKLLLIDFVRDADVAFVWIASPATLEGRPDAGPCTVSSAETVALLDLSREYVERNMRLIAEDSFGEDSEAVRRVAAATAKSTARVDRP